MGEKEQIQEGEYAFPYHHLVSLSPFSEGEHLSWGFKYAAYIGYVLDSLKEKGWESLIDFGCGDGKVTREIAHTFPERRVVGVDYSERSLQFARAFSPSLEFATRTEEKFDAFVLIEVLEHIDPQQMNDFLELLSKNLEPGGFGIITTPSDNIPTNPKHYQHFNAQSFEKTLASHFTIERFEYLLAKGPGVRIIQSLLANRLFLLRYKPLVQFLYRWYKRSYLRATPQSGAQVFAVVRRKD